MLNEDPVRKNLQTFWEVEAIGIPSEEEEDIVMETFENNIYFNGSRYVTKLSFKEGCEGVPDNYSFCIGRPHSLRKRLMANPKLLKDYSDIIEDYKAQSIVEEVTDVGPPGKTHYLPHQAVLREEHDTTKTRECLMHPLNLKTQV